MALAQIVESSRRSAKRMANCVMALFQVIGGGFVVREVAAVFEDLTQLHVQAFDRVGGIDHFSDLRREGQEGHDVLPSALPARNDSGVFFAHSLRANRSSRSRVTSAFSAA